MAAQIQNSYTSYTFGSETIILSFFLSLTYTNGQRKHYKSIDKISTFLINKCLQKKIFCNRVNIRCNAIHIYFMDAL